MSKEIVKGKALKHGTQTRTMHWIHLITFILLGFTGIGFHWSGNGINNLFGGGANASLVHVWTGVIFTLGPTLYILLNFDRFARFIDTITTFTRNDMAWFKVLGGYVPFIKMKVRPPQDKYNAGQKVLGWLVIIGCFLMIFTGFEMWLGRHTVSAAFLNTCYAIHFWTGMVLIIMIAGHFYLAAINSKSRGEFASMMIDGYVDAASSAEHNSKWFSELRKEA
ncbi:formate dehydrogenase [Desulfosporosinus sp. Tol-M]|jgi:Cytochrome b subunit of formate dehydrogenase|nr:formate dehydrogenase [Desulfosporosinus sp. Tol-M]